MWQLLESPAVQTTDLLLTFHKDTNPFCERTVIFHLAFPYNQHAPTDAPK